MYLINAYISPVIVNRYMKLGMWFAVTENYNNIQFQNNRTINRNVMIQIVCEEVYLSVVVATKFFRIVFYFFCYSIL